MKTTIEATTEKSNDLRHTINGANFQIKIRLNDECKNGHQDFSITGTFWEFGKPHTDKYMTTGGCCHDEILRVRPDLKLFVDLHLSTANGVPMYAIENGFFHLKNGEQRGKSAKDITMEYLRVTEKEFDLLATAEDKIYFQALIEKLGIPERWQNEADQAIAMLEGMTGKQFVNDSQKTGFIPLGDKLKEVEQLIESGYYSPEKIAERNDQKKADAKTKILRDLHVDFQKGVQKLENQYAVNLAVANADLSLHNFIYYDHTNEGVFNWNTSSYNQAITQEQFDAFINSVDYLKLPKGIVFKLGKDKK